MNNSNNNVPVVGNGNAAVPQNLVSGLSVAGATNGSSLAMANASAASALGMIMAAQAVPRDELMCLRKIQDACGREYLANISQYALARGGTDISGPTVHLLKALAGYWRNIKHGVTITNETQFSTSGVAYAWDMEANHYVEEPFTVKHVRYTREGTKPLTNPDDIRYLVNNYASRASRKVLESVIPEDVVQQAIAWCNETLAADMKKFNAEKMLEAFAQYGVTKADVEAFAQRSIESLPQSPGHVVRLRKILTSLKDGVAKKEDFFKGTDMEDIAETGKEGNGSAQAAKPAKKVGKTVESFLAEHPQVVKAADESGSAPMVEVKQDGKADVLELI